MTQKVWSADLILTGTPLNRFAELADVVEPILFLLSDGAGMIDGVYLPTDGGIRRVGCFFGLDTSKQIEPDDWKQR